MMDENKTDNSVKGKTPLPRIPLLAGVVLIAAVIIVALFLLQHKGASLLSRQPRDSQSAVVTTSPGVADKTQPQEGSSPYADPKVPQKTQIEKKENEAQGQSFDIFLGYINERLAARRKSNFNVTYLLDHNICEFNKTSFKWEETGKTPEFGTAFEIVTEKGFSTWCVAIGSFADKDHQRRVLLITGRLAETLQGSRVGASIPARIRILDDAQCRAIAGCGELRDLYEKERGTSSSQATSTQGANTKANPKGAAAPPNSP